MTSSTRTAELAAPVDAADARRSVHPWRWLATAVLVLLAAMLGHLLVTNKRFEWHVVASYLDASVIGHALWTTIELTIIAMAIGMVGGVLIAAGRLSVNPVLRTVCGGYVWFFRGTPLLVQLIFWYNLSYLLPRLSVGIPFGPTFAHASTNSLITPMLAAILGLGLNECAYMAEIVRGGLLAVDPGQTEAASALGLPRTLILRRIVLPQAMRSIIPPTGSQVIGMLKATALVSVIAMADLLYTVQSIYNQTFQTIPMLVVACIWYLVITTILYIGQSFIERRYSRGASRTAPTSYLSFLRPFRRPATSPVTLEAGR